MKLLSIKAHGFKSFADKIEITVGDGITGIVGPNGSGKSNVVDAVKWVLGETSLKEIRGGETMSDVIFSGSQSRSPLTRAWVSLTFDNQDHYLACDYETVEIKREVYKTGENEYYINNSKVRKKDITDLFLDSGANADSFSIISQGKIMDILKGKSSDRRVIIEEAAGVLTYKKRKEDTLRKLDNTKDNLEKVNLVIDELEVNVEPLRIQAETANKYLSFKDELKDIEIALLSSDIEKENNTYSELKERLEVLNNEILNMSNKSSGSDASLEKLKLKSLKLDESINVAQDSIIKLNQELSQLETQKQVISERKKYEVDDQKLEANIINLKENVVLVKKNLSTLELEMENETKELDKLIENSNKFRNDYKNDTVKKNTLSSELSNKNKEEIILKNKIESLKEEIENDTKIPYSVKSVINNPRLSGIHDVLCKLIDTEEKYSTALEIALGNNTNVIVCDDERSATSAISYLKENKLGRATFFPISIIKEKYVDDATIATCKGVAGFINVASELVTYNPMYSNIIKNCLGNTLIVDNINTMNALGKKINYRYRVITLDGEILASGGAMTGGATKASKGLLNTKFELEKATKALTVKENEQKLILEHIDELTNELSILEHQIFDIDSKIASSKTNLETKNKTKIELNNKLTDINNELEGTKNKLNNTTDKELDRVLERLLSVSTKIEAENSKLSNLKTDKNDLLSEINELELLNKKENAEYNKKLSESKDIEISIGKLDVKLDTLLTRLSEEYQITFERAKETYELSMDENVARSKVNQLKRDIRDLGDVNVGSITEYERVNTRYTFLSEQRNDLNNAIGNLMEIITDLDQTMEDRFKETFEKVNNEFGTVFKKLFKGGNAKLILTDPDNLLSTGVDIDALPPGKSLKNINSLSGGEMTLTAIALLFSILNIRTVPFCILDEVEAALDEANVDQFGTYIKEYEHNSQFIVITHKKRTMEYANNLYGITMQESGVSKLVSVKLENVN